MDGLANELVQLICIGGFLFLCLIIFCIVFDSYTKSNDEMGL